MYVYASLLILAILTGCVIGSYLVRIISTLRHGSILQIATIIGVIAILILCLILVGDRM